MPSLRLGTPLLRTCMVRVVPRAVLRTLTDRVVLRTLTDRVALRTLTEQALRTPIRDLTSSNTQNTSMDGRILTDSRPSVVLFGEKR
jgi:hypothetical protein